MLIVDWRPNLEYCFSFSEFIEKLLYESIKANFKNPIEHEMLLWIRHQFLLNSLLPIKIFLNLTRNNAY